MEFPRSRCYDEQVNHKYLSEDQLPHRPLRFDKSVKERKVVKRKQNRQIREWNHTCVSDLSHFVKFTHNHLEEVHSLVESGSFDDLKA